MNDNATRKAAEKLEQIRALLAKAESTEFQGEADICNEKASELMARYGIDRAMLAAAQPDTDRVGDRVFTCPPPYSYDKMLLLHGIAESLGARTIRIRAKGKIDGHQLHVFGMESDLERIDILFTSLLMQAMRFMTADYYRRRTPDDPKVWKRDWLRGFSAEVRARLQAAERRVRNQAEQEAEKGPSVALVLADRSTLVSQAFAAQYPRTRTSSSSRRVGGRLRPGQGCRAAGRPRRCPCGRRRIARHHPLEPQDTTSAAPDLNCESSGAARPGGKAGGTVRRAAVLPYHVTDGCLTVIGGRSTTRNPIPDARPDGGIHSHPPEIKEKAAMIDLIDPSRSRAEVDALEALAHQLRRMLWELPDDSPQRPGAATTFTIVEHARLTAIARDHDVHSLWETLDNAGGVRVLDPAPLPAGINIAISAGRARSLDDVAYLLCDIQRVARSTAGFDDAIAVVEEHRANAWKHYRRMRALRDRRQSATAGSCR